VSVVDSVWRRLPLECAELCVRRSFTAILLLDLIGFIIRAAVLPYVLSIRDRRWFERDGWF